MKEWLLPYLILSILAGSACRLAQGKKFEKHLRFLSGMLLLCALIAPLYSIVRGGFPILTDRSQTAIPIRSGTDEVFQKELDRLLQNELQATTEKRTGLTLKDFSVEVTTSLKDTNVSLESLTVRLYSFPAIAKRETIAKILNEYADAVFFIEELGGRKE